MREPPAEVWTPAVRINCSWSHVWHFLTKFLPFPYLSTRFSTIKNHAENFIVTPMAIIIITATLAPRGETTICPAKFYHAMRGHRCIGQEILGRVDVRLGEERCSC